MDDNLTIGYDLSGAKYKKQKTNNHKKDKIVVMTT